MGETDDLATQLPNSVNENLGTIAAHYERNEERVSRSQAIVEKSSHYLGSPAYVVGNMVFIVGWIAWNLIAPGFGFTQFDEPPFFWLQGFIGLNALLISTTVLIRQNRMAKLAEHNAHLHLQISLLAEEKASKIIAMLEELRRDSPDVPDKVDDEAHELAESADTHVVLEAIERQHGQHES